MFYFSDVLQVNVIGLSIATRESIKSMREGNFDGHVVSINSILGHHVANFPLSNMYSPSKHAVTAIHEVLRQELASMGSKIKITVSKKCFFKLCFMCSGPVIALPEPFRAPILKTT